MIVKEHINEKFVEDSDPVKDMGIGYKENFILRDQNEIYYTNVQKDISTIIKKRRAQLRKLFKQKLLGKIITGDFFNFNTYKWAKNISIEVVKIKLDFSSVNMSDRIYEVRVYTRRGTPYSLDDSHTYKITMK